MSLLSDAKATVAKFLVNMGRFDVIMNGDKTTDVPVDVGTVPTLRKLFDFIVENVVGVKILGSVASVNDLPAINNKIGDIYIVTTGGNNNAANDGYVWTGSQPWRNIGQIRGQKGDTGSPGSASVTGTGGFWTDLFRPRVSPPAATTKQANMVRLADRVLIGNDAVKYTGDHDGVFPPSSWLWSVGKQAYAYLPRISTMIVQANYGSNAALFASRVSDRNQLPDYDKSEVLSMALAYVAVNDDAVNPREAWGFYGTSVRTQGAGQMVNEWDILNATDSVERLTAYGTLDRPFTIGLALNSGGEAADYNRPAGDPPFPNTSPATVALVIAGNGQTWDKGIIFKNSGISPTTDGTTVAIEFSAGQNLRWVSDDTGNTMSFINGVVSDYANQIGLTFQNEGAIFGNKFNSLLVQISNVSLAANRLVLTAGKAGQGASIGVNGSDPSADLNLSGNGQGVVDINKARIRGSAPTSSNFPGTVNEIRVDGFNIYVCIAPNVWKRAILSDF